MQSQIVLVMLFSPIELLQGHDFGDNRFRKRPCACHLLHVGFRDSFLIRRDVKNRGTILISHIRALPIELSRIVRHAKEYLQQLLILPVVFLMQLVNTPKLIELIT